MSALLKEISKLEQAYLREPLKKYLLVSDISFHIPANRLTVVLGGNHITFSRQLRGKIQRDVSLSWVVISLIENYPNPIHAFK